LEYAREVKPGVFVQISTDEVLGPTEGKNDGYKEWDPYVPSNPYAASKAAQEMFAIAYWRTYNVPVIITNTMNNFGEMQSSTKYPVMVQKAVSRGDKIVIHGDEGGIGSRSYIHSRNFADAVLFIIKNTKPHLHQPGTIDKPDKYHIAGDKQLDNLELAQLIAKLMGEELKYEIVNFHHTRSGHDKHYGLNDQKLKSLGWKSPVSFEESLSNTIKWQSENPLWIE
jgi:dTDP-glucose 4,6-dehydratase